MTFTTKIKLEIEDLGKVFDLTYRRPTKKDDKRIKNLATTRIDEELEKEKQRSALQVKLADAEDKDSIKKEIEAIALMSMAAYQNEIDEYAFKLLVSGYDEAFTDFIGEYETGYTDALAEVRKLSSEVVEKKSKK